MISPAYLAESFGRNVQILKQQTNGITQEESLLQLPFRANCMNWVVGHILGYRNSLCRLVNVEPAFDAERLARYARESEPITGDQPGVLQLQEMMAALEVAQTRIAAGIVAITPDGFERQVALTGRTVRSVGEWLLFSYFHETYHVGQTEILRQATGKADKVI